LIINEYKITDLIDFYIHEIGTEYANVILVLCMEAKLKLLTQSTKYKTKEKNKLINK